MVRPWWYETNRASQVRDGTEKGSCKLQTDYVGYMLGLWLQVGYGQEGVQAITHAQLAPG